MSLISVETLSNLLPVILVEARVRSQSDNTLCLQFGVSFDTDQCNIALYTRTSGLLMVIGVGSYVIYRMFVKLFGKSFPWELVEQVPINLLRVNINESCILKRSKLVDGYMFENRQIYRMSDKKRIEDGFFHKNSSSNKPVLKFRSSSNHSRSQSKHSANHVCSIQPTSSEVSYTSESNCSLRSKCRSWNSSARRSRTVSRDSEFSSSEKSASLRLIWDEPEWDDQIDFPNEIVHSQSPCPSCISELSEFRAAKTFFDENILQKATTEGNRMNVSDTMSMNDDISETNITAVHEFIERNCLTDSKYLYKIVSGCITSETTSVCSEASSNAFRSFRNHVQAANMLTGFSLSNMADCMATNDDGKAACNSMTDSAISRGTISTIERRNDRCSMLDSAISVDSFSSDDEACTSGFANTHFIYSSKLTHRKNQSVLRRSNLNLINEDQLSVGTTRSLEWFTDNNSDYINDEGQQKGDKKSFLIAPENLDVSVRRKPKNALNDTRDLIVWAREFFFAESLQLKALQSLYSSESRIRRIGVQKFDEAKSNLILSAFRVMLHHKFSFFPYSNLEQTCEEILEVFCEYDFMKRWRTFSKTTVVGRNSHVSSNCASRAIHTVTLLWNLEQNCVHFCDAIESECVEAIELLMIVRVLKIFENYERNDAPVSEFHKRLFMENDPRVIAEGIRQSSIHEIDLYLLADSFGLDLEVYELPEVNTDGTLKKTFYSVELKKQSRFSTDNEFKCELTKPVVSLLRMNNSHFYPLYRSLN